MSLYSTDWSAKSAFVSGSFIYLIVLYFSMTIISFLNLGIKNFWKTYLLLLLPGIPPSPLFLTKLWSINFFNTINFSFSLFLFLIINVLLVYIYINFSYKKISSGRKAKFYNKGRVDSFLALSTFFLFMMFLNIQHFTII